MDTDAKALGVYLTLLIVRFRVRYQTDVPMLRSNEFLFGARLKPFLSLFLHEEQELKEALTSGKEFLNVLSKNTSFSDFDEALDDSNRALEINPEYYWAYYTRGLIYLETGETDKGIADLTLACENGEVDACEELEKTGK